MNRRIGVALLLGLLAVAVVVPAQAAKRAKAGVATTQVAAACPASACCPGPCNGAAMATSMAKPAAKAAATKLASAPGSICPVSDPSQCGPCPMPCAGTGAVAAVAQSH